MMTTNNTIMSKKVFKKDMVTVYGTGNSRIPEGVAKKVHVIVAEKLEASGAASRTKPAEGSGKKGGKKEEGGTK